MPALTVEEQNPLQAALDAAKNADKKRTEAISSLLTQQKSLAVQQEEIVKSLKALNYKPTRKPRTKKAKINQTPSGLAGEVNGITTAG